MGNGYIEVSYLSFIVRTAAKVNCTKARRECQKNKNHKSNIGKPDRGDNRGTKEKNTNLTREDNMRPGVWEE